jgi:hypothetical protein
MTPAVSHQPCRRYGDFIPLAEVPIALANGWRLLERIVIHAGARPIRPDLGPQHNAYGCLMAWPCQCRCVEPGKTRSEEGGGRIGMNLRYSSSPLILSAALMSLRCAARSGPYFAIVLERPKSAFPAFIGSRPNLVNTQVAACSVSPNDRICEPRSRNASRASLAPGIMWDTSMPSLPGVGLKTGTLANCSIRRLTSRRRSKKLRTGRAANSKTIQVMAARPIGHAIPINFSIGAPYLWPLDPERSRQQV